LTAETLQQVRSEGQALADKGVVHQSSLGSGSPAPTPAVKYGGHVENASMSRSLSQGKSL
jgi:hypothetical protein